MQELAREHVPFLSTRRCRHFLSLIAERLLQAVAATPDPDRTLVDLVRVSDSLGGKGVLWELFSFHPASLQLYVRLCAASPYLSGILTTNPGMIDDLVDSLQLDRLPTREELERSLGELVAGTSDVLPILHDLKNSAALADRGPRYSQQRPDRRNACGAGRRGRVLSASHDRARIRPPGGQTWPAHAGAGSL